MAIQFGTSPIKEMQYNGVTIGEAMMDGQIVYRSMPTIRLTGEGAAARTQFREALVEYGTTFDTVTELPFRVDARSVTNASYVFQNCYALAHPPYVDVSGVTFLTYLFQNCRALVTAPPLDTSAATHFTNMFDGCESLSHVPDLDAGNVLYTNRMLRGCVSLTDGNVRLIGKNPDVSTGDMILDSGLTRLPFYDANGNPI